jgi:hypothetical protein
MSAEHEMPRVDVPSAGPFEEIACFARLEKDDGSARLCLRDQDREKRGAAAGQQLGKLVTLAVFGERQLMSLSAGG